MELNASTYILYQIVTRDKCKAKHSEGSQDI